SQMYVGLADITNPLMEQANFDILFSDLGKSTFDGFNGTLNISLKDEVEFLDLAFLHVEGIEADLTKRHRFKATLFGLFLCTHFGSTLVGYNFQAITSTRDLSETHDTHRRARRCFLDALATVVEHSTHFARCRARSEEHT